VKLFLGLCAGTVLLLAFIGCSSDKEGGKLGVDLDEWSITIDKTSVPEGPIEFTIKNNGSLEHEVVIVRTDLEPDALPTKDDGSVDLDAPDVHEERSIEEIGDGDETGRTFSLDPGNYVLIDNKVEEVDGEETAYYGEGMYAGFTVTEEGESTPLPSGS
jgi:hypothetical protein